MTSEKPESDAIELRRKQVRFMRASGKGETQWGVVLDDAGSADMFDTRTEAEEQYVLLGGVGLIRVGTAMHLPPTVCGIDLGTRPGWMSPDQYDACPCVLPFAHEGDCECSCDKEGKPRG